MEPASGEGVSSGGELPASAFHALLSMHGTRIAYVNMQRLVCLELHTSMLKRGAVEVDIIATEPGTEETGDDCSRCTFRRFRAGAALSLHRQQTPAENTHESGTMLWND